MARSTFARTALAVAIALPAAGAVEQGIHQKLAELQRKRNFRPDDLAAGREYVSSYVTFVQYVEGLHEAIEAGAAGHYLEGDPAPAEHHK